MRSKLSSSLGGRLRTIRRWMGMTQTRFTKTLGVCTQAFISQVESGHSGPSTAMLAALEKLGFSPNWLMSGEGEMRLESEEPVTVVSDKASRWRLLPILGRVPADYPGCSPAEEHIEGYFPMPAGMILDADAFCLRVNSDSMKGQAEKGDIVIVFPSLKGEVKDGDLVVVRIEGDDVFLKRFARSEGRAVLFSSNPKYPPIIIDDDRSVTIIGKVTYTIHHYK